MKVRLAKAFADVGKPAVRQLGSLTGLLVALIAMALVPGVATDTRWIAVAASMVVLGMLAAIVLPWERWPGRFVLVIPITSLLAFGLLRVGTGGTTSVFAALLLLPVIWIAAERGRIWVVVAAFMTGLSMALPWIIGGEPWVPSQAVRLVISPVVFATVALIINVLTEHAHRQVEAATQLAQTAAATNDSLRAAEAFNRSVWEAVRHQAVVITDVDGRIVEWGPGAARLLEMSRSDAVGRMATHFLQPADAVRADGLAFETMLELARSDEIADGFEVRTGSGGRVPVDVTYGPRLGPNGEVLGYILIAHDMRQAREAARLKDEFVGSISHELRTPLSSVLGYLELAREDEAGLSDTQSRYLEVAERNARRLLALVGDLLFVAQVDAGRFPLELSRFDVRGVVRAAAESAMPHATRVGVSMAVEVPDEPLEVRGDPTRIGQAIDNLVSNALKFTPRGGSVTVRLSRFGHELCVAVVDTGLGIPEDEMERLFTRFFRSTTSTRQAVQGVGLGLNITRAIVEAHGGRIDASSIEGEGTTFEIWLPALGE